MTTTSLSDELDTTMDDYKIHRVQLDENIVGPSGFDYTAKLEEIQEMASAAEAAYLKASENCDDPEAAQAAAEEAREAANNAATGYVELRDGLRDDMDTIREDPSKSEEEKTEETRRLWETYSGGLFSERTANEFADKAEGIANAAKRGERCVGVEGIPMSQSEPPLPAHILAAATSSPDPTPPQQYSLRPTGHPDIRDPTHPDHPRFEQAYTGVARIDDERRRVSDEYSVRLAAALTLQSKADGLDAIRNVAMNREGTWAFAIDTHTPTTPWANQSAVEVAQAVGQSVEMSNEKIAQLNIQLARQQEAAPGISIDQPTRSGPSLA